ncbi:MAG: aminoacyl-tRNA hydrolase [Desulfatiglans sp.]|nr:aminoacyl-tRNA hydrolase [Thermodesulfobacteriota bacterium]MEE4352930.1 aminoacyl-tRNA hydrolase [Desulfatiglans sp.]
MFLFVGLGNPGLKYEQTRHNIGERAIDLWSRRLGIRLNRKRFHSRIAVTTVRDQRIILLVPMTYMNKSGISVRECLDYYDLDIRRVVVIHDDLDLPVGRIKIARHGGTGGHRGVSSIINSLGSKEFPRIKVGIGRPRYDESIEDFVLSPVYHDQKDILKGVVKIAVDVCEVLVSEGVESAMNRFNCHNLVKKEGLN